MDEVRFNLPGYMSSLGPFFQSVNRAVVQSSSLIGQIAERPTHHRGPSRNAPQPNPVEHSQASVTITYEVPFDVIRNGDVEAFVDILIAHAEKQFVPDLERQFIGIMQDVTHATGAEIDVEGKPLSFDQIIDLIEAMDIRSDENDQLVLPTIVGNPETVKILRSLETTPEQFDRLNAVLRKKHEENLRKKRSRRIGR